MKFDFVVFLKGILMGICDLIPGISGGTIAFITGIYERLIFSIKGILSVLAIRDFFVLSFSFLFYPSKKNFKKLNNFFVKKDLYFLFTLLAGIVFAVFLGSWVIVFFLDNYFVLTMMFFIGLIIASSFSILKKIEKSNNYDSFFSIFGFLIGSSLVLFAPSNSNITLFYIFLSGFVSICAMLLPGISGSYLLYLMGSYDFILRAIKDFFNSFYVYIVFEVGVIFGAVFSSRIIAYLLKNHHSKTLYFLFGFMFGALLIPIRDILIKGFSFYEIFVGFVLLILGFILVLLIEKHSN